MTKDEAHALAMTMWANQPMQSGNDEHSVNAATYRTLQWHNDINNLVGTLKLLVEDKEFDADEWRQIAMYGKPSKK